MAPRASIVFITTLNAALVGYYLAGSSLVDSVWHSDLTLLVVGSCWDRSLPLRVDVTANGIGV